MRVVGWHTAIRGLVTTCLAYVEGASANLVSHVRSVDPVQWSFAVSPRTFLFVSMPEGFSLFTTRGLFFFYTSLDLLRHLAFGIHGNGPDEADQFTSHSCHRYVSVFPSSHQLQILAV